MVNDYELLAVEEVATFSPDDRQITLKMLVHERMNPQVIGKITLETLSTIEPFISPFTLLDVYRWVKVPGFYEWLFTPDSYLLRLHKTKEKAAETLVELLEVSNYDEEINAKVLGIKLKAAELLLKSGMKREQRIQNTVKVNASIPKHLASKSVEAIEEELRKLKE